MKFILKNQLLAEIVVFLMAEVVIYGNHNFENSAERLLAFFICLAAASFVKVCMIMYYPKCINYITCLFALSEMGILMNLYICGFSAGRTWLEIYDYCTSIISYPLCMMLILFIESLLEPEEENTKSLKVPLIGILFVMFLMYGWPSVTDPKNLASARRSQIVTVVIEALFIGLCTILFSAPSYTKKADEQKPISESDKGIKKFLKRFWEFIEEHSLGCSAFFAGIAVALMMIAIAKKDQTTFRNAVIETLKITLLLGISCFCKSRTQETIKLKKEKKEAQVEKYQITFFGAVIETLKIILSVVKNSLCKNKTQEKKRKSWIFLVYLLIMGVSTLLIGLMASEFGSVLILVFFCLLFSIKLQSSITYYTPKNTKKNAENPLKIQSPLTPVAITVLIIVAYCLARTVAGNIEPGTGGLIGKMAGKLERLVNFDSNTQISEMIAVIDNSPTLLVALPYHIDIVGHQQTLVEDFSYMCIISVFGMIIAILLLLIMLCLPIKLIHDLRLKLSAEEFFSVRGLFYMGGCMLFLANTIVHVISNSGTLFFTGVPLPLLSNGFMNTAVFCIIFTQILKTLEYGMERKC